METQCKQILSHLKSGKNLTALQAERLFDCMRLAARIKNLKEAGHNIEKIMTKVGRKKKHVARYFIKGGVNC